MVASECKMADQDFEIGVDCVEISSFIDKRHSFFKKIFTDKEMKYCDNKGKPIQHYAVRFAGKEAVIKALYPFGLFLDVTQIEILNKESGNPYARLLVEEQDLYKIRISLSHSKNVAIAMAMVVRKNG